MIVTKTCPDDLSSVLLLTKQEIFAGMPFCKQVLPGKFILTKGFFNRQFSLFSSNNGFPEEFLIYKCITGCSKTFPFCYCKNQLI